MQEDLSAFNQELLFFEKIESSGIEKSPLSYPYKYEIATMYPNNCSCYLRIFEQDLFKEIGFCDLQDWLKEEIDESIINTRQFFRIIKEIVNKGFKIDCFTCWSDDVNEINRIDVDINNIPENHFALFNDTYFNYH